MSRRARIIKSSTGGLPLVLLVVCLLSAAVLGLAAPALAQCASSGTSLLPPPAVDFLRGYRASFASPTRLAVDALGRVYIADPAHGRVVVRGADGRLLESVELGNPVSVAVEANGERIYVGDGNDGRVTAYTAGWLRLFDLGQGHGELTFPGDIALDPATGNAWVTDSFAHQVKVYSPTGTLLFSIGGRGNEIGRFQFPAGIHADATSGEILVADQVNGRVQIFDGDGNFVSCIGVKGTGAGRLNMPQGIWTDHLGRVYVTDAFEGWVHVIDRQGATVSWIGGVADAGVGPGQLITPSDVVIDPSGRLFVASSTTAALVIFGLDAYSDPERFVPAEVDLDPEILDPLPGSRVRAVIEVPGYRLALVEPATIVGNGVAAIPGSAVAGDADGDHVPDLSIAFDGPALAATLTSGGGTVRVSGRLGVLELEGFDHLEVAAGPGGDADGDGVPDAADRCPGTVAGTATDHTGCGLDQLCPCSGPTPGEAWKNHGQYVSCVARRVREISRPPLDQATRQRLVTEAAQSACGK